ncbi:TPA: hypothetical protein ACS62P_002309 [Klebsiella pneumoniae]
MLNKVANVDLRLPRRTAKAQPGVGVSYILGIDIYFMNIVSLQNKKSGQRRRGVDPA